MLATPSGCKFQTRGDAGTRIQRSRANAALAAAASFIQGISGMLPMMLVLAFMFTVCMSIKTLVLEKELRLKEVLRAVGIRNGALWAARFTENLVLLTLPCALMSVMVKVSDPAPGGVKAQSIR